MNTFQKSVSILLVSAILPSAIFAAGLGMTLEPLAAPHPTKVVKPTAMPREYLGETIEVTFVIDEKGQPHDIKILSHFDRDLTVSVTKAIKQWQFTPVVKNGVLVKQRVVLPVEFSASS